MASPRPWDRHAVLQVAGILVAVLSLAFLGFRLLSQLKQVPAVAWTGLAIAALLAAVALVVLIEVIHSLGWRTLARGIEPSATWRESFAVCGRSQIAKYLPGNVFHYVQRVVLARDAGMGAVKASALTVVDAVLLAGAGVLVGLPAMGQALGMTPRFAGSGRWLVMLFIAVGLLIGGSVVLSVPELRRQIRTVAGVLDPRRLAVALMLNAGLFVLAGVAVHLVLHGFWPGVSRLVWTDFVSGFALAFLLGFVTPGAPGGMGVREIVLYGLYAPELGGGLAAGLFLLLRLVYILGDTATFVAASSIQAAGTGRPGARADTP